MNHKEELLQHNILITENKEKFQEVSIAPMHTAEHILNQTMVRLFGCARSKNAHIERKKSKCDYFLASAPTDEQMATVEKKVNEVIASDLPVTVEWISRNELPGTVDLSKLPEETGDTLRVVKIGHYDICACIGQHVTHTCEIGKFKIISWDFEQGRLRIRFKLEGNNF